MNQLPHLSCTAPYIAAAVGPKVVDSPDESAADADPPNAVRAANSRPSGARIEPNAATCVAIAFPKAAASEVGTSRYDLRLVRQEI